jgi:hypothetical protein
MILRQFSFVCFVLSIIGASLAQAEEECSVQGESNPAKYFAVPMRKLENNVYTVYPLSEEPIPVDLNNSVAYFRHRKLSLNLEAEKGAISEECKKKFDREFYRNLVKARKEHQTEYANKCMPAPVRDDKSIPMINANVAGAEVDLSQEALGDPRSPESETASYVSSCGNWKREIEIFKNLEAMVSINRAKGLLDGFVSDTDTPVDAAKTIGGK